MRRRSKVRTLTNAELIAVLLITDAPVKLPFRQRKSPRDERRSLDFDTSLEELQEVPGIGRVKSIRILAAGIGSTSCFDRQRETRTALKARTMDSLRGRDALPASRGISCITLDEIASSVSQISQGGLVPPLSILVIFFARRLKPMRHRLFLSIIIRVGIPHRRGRMWNRRENSRNSKHDGHPRT